MLPLSGCEDAAPIWNYFFGDLPRTVWNQRYVVTLDTPEGRRSYEGTIEIDFVNRRNRPALGSGSPTSVSKRGEAVPIPMGEGRWMFALLPDVTWADLVAIAQNHAWERGERPGAAEAVQLLPRYLNDPQPVLKQFRPKFITFPDLADPMSIELVDADDLAATFGEGYALVGVTEYTNRQPESGRLFEVLPWMREVRMGTFDGTGGVGMRTHRLSGYAMFREDPR